MAQELYGFFNSVDDDTRSYEADELASAFCTLSQSGVAAIDDSCLKVSPEGSTMRTLVSPGRAMVQGYFYELRDDGTEQTAFTHTLVLGMERIDRIVVRLDLTARTVSLIKREGVAAVSDPQPPALNRTSTLWELSLAKVHVRNSASEILATDVTDERMDESVCGAALPEGVTLSKLWGRMAKANASTSAPGLMSAADKTKLDGLVPLTNAQIDAVFTDAE